MERKQQDQTQQPRNSQNREDIGQNRTDRSGDVRQDKRQESQTPDSTRQTKDTDRKY